MRQIDMFDTKQFGTPAKKLVRRSDPPTAIAGALAIDTTKSEREVYEAILTFGNRGCISTDIEKLIPHRPSHSITPRFAPLKRKGLIVEVGKRMGLYGVEVMAYRAVK